MSKLNIEEKISLVKEVGEEIINEEELRELFKTKEHPIAYDGFEPSGEMHIAQGILRTININKLTKAGIKFKMLVADWHAWANNKMGGDLKKIQTIGDYFIEIWKACGMDLKNVEFVRSSDLLKKESYWKTVMEVARASTLKRIIRCSQIMGRKESESLQASQILYPCMQCADIFELNVDITQLGMDQRKVNVLAREIGPKLGFWKPIIVSHHILMGLGQQPKSGSKGMERTIELKMSKSKPDSAIFMTDTYEDIKRKIKKAYCKEGEINDNPILEYYKYIIFEKFNSLEIKRKKEFGGNIKFNSYKELENSFLKKEIHPTDLKNDLIKRLNELIEPVREHFKKDLKAKKILEEVKNFKK